MTNKTKSLTFVFAFAAILLAWPMTAQTANADGEGILSGTCGFDEPGSIDFGTIARGTVGTETIDSWAALGSETGNIDLDAGDWFDLGERGIGTLTHDGSTEITAGSTITIGTETYLADAGGDAGAFEFDIDNGFAQDFENLADSIIANSLLVTAVKTSGTVTTVTSILRGDSATTGNIPLGDTGTTGVTPVSAVNGGDNPVVHLQSEVTKFFITTDGADPAESGTGTNYAGKTAIGAASVDTEIVALTDPNNALRTAFQITGVDPALENLPFSGSLAQVLTFTVTCNVT